jgi:hypothetical protein
LTGDAGYQSFFHYCSRPFDWIFQMHDIMNASCPALKAVVYPQDRDMSERRA